MTRIHATDTAAATDPSPSARGHEQPYSREEFTAWLTASCQNQNVPVTITDPAVLAQVATVLRHNTAQTRRDEGKHTSGSQPLRRSA